MKTFKEHLKEDTGKMVGTVPSSGDSIEDGSIGAHNIHDPAVLKRVNAFVGAIGDGEYLNPQAAVEQLSSKLATIGLGFNATLDGDKGTTTAEVTQFGSRFGKELDTKPEDVINDDGISHKKEGGLNIEFKYETLQNGTSKVYAKLV